MARSRGAGPGERVRSDAGDAARERLAQNPFFVLELARDCSRAEVERQGQKLLGMLELELSGARRYRSPIGEHERSPNLVRAAMAELRDPNRRLLHELWAMLEPVAARDPDRDGDGDDGEQGGATGQGATGETGPDLRPFPALRALGFGDWLEDRGRS